MALLEVWLRVRGLVMPVSLAARRGVSRLSVFVLLFLISARVGSADTWTPLKNLAPSSVALMIQMTDGTILVQSYDGQSWRKLTPDITGSYINGTWTTLASAPIARLYFADQVLPNGKFWITGGEYSGPGLLANWSNTGYIYDPVANTWTTTAPYPNQPQPGCPFISYLSGNLTSGSPQITGIYPYTSGLVVGWGVSGTGIPSGATIVSIDSATQITVSANAAATLSGSRVNFNHSYELTVCLGDEPSMLLPGGMILVGNLVFPNTYIYNVATNSWAETGTKHYPESSDEEGWTKLANGGVFNYDLFHSIATGGSYAEIYTPSTGTWSGISPSDGSAAGTIPQLSSSVVGFELGPSLRLQDGRVLVIGATQHTGLYTPSTNTWAAGPDTIGTLSGSPAAFGADDAAAAILPNGHVIFSADAGVSGFTSSGNITSGSNIITNIPPTAILQRVWKVTGFGIPAGSEITSVDSPTQVHISQNATATRPTTA